MNELPKTLWDRTYDIWAALDWSRTNAELSGELQCSITTVAKWREIVTGDNISAKRYGKGYDIDWDKVDWAKNNSLLSRETGVPIGVVAYTRSAQNRPFPSIFKWHTKFTDEQIASVDWAYTKDIDIAAQFGISRERVRQVRACQQLPECLVATLQDPNRIAVVRWCHEHRAEIEGKSMHEVSTMIPDYGIRRELLYKLFRKTKIPMTAKRAGQYAKATKSLAWATMNWDLPDMALSLIYNFARHTIPQNRYGYQRQRPKWWLGGGFNRQSLNPEFLEACEAELVKAKAIGVGNEKRFREWLAYKQNEQNQNWRSKNTEAA